MINKFRQLPLICSPLLIAIVTLAISLSGCGPSNKLPQTAKVKGTVTYQGKPVANVTVTFIGDKAPSPASGDTNSQGEFELGTYAPGDGAFPGHHKITIAPKRSAAAPGAASLDGADYAKAMQELTEKKPAEEEKLPFPKKYTDIATTDLEFDVSTSKPNQPMLELRD